MGMTFDSQHLSRFITHKTYGFMRSQRPNLGALLVSACAVIDKEMTDKSFELGLSNVEDGVEVARTDTEECAVGNTMIEALIHFADEL
jgi:hypothetical protein